MMSQTQPLINHLCRDASLDAYYCGVSCGVVGILVSLDIKEHICVAYRIVVCDDSFM